MVQIQENIEKLTRELKYRNYSPKTIKVYTNCLKYFLQKIKTDILNLSAWNNLLIESERWWKLTTTL